MSASSSAKVLLKHCVLKQPVKVQKQVCKCCANCVEQPTQKRLHAIVWQSMMLRILSSEQL